MPNLWDDVKNLSAEDKISKAKISLNKEHPFFAYLIEHLRMHEDTKGVLPMPTMGVDGKGNCYYSTEFVKGLDDIVLKGVLAHEVLHVANEHSARRRGRNLMVNGTMLWNIAADISINHLLLENKFNLPEEGLIPQGNSITIMGYELENISDKAVEDIYEELKVHLKQMVSEGKAKEISPNSGEYSAEGNVPKPFDNHLEDQEGDGQGEGEGDSQGQGKGKGNGQTKNPIAQGNKDWKKVMAEAFNHAKLRGSAPMGMERMFSDVHKHRLSWRSIIRRIVTSKIPYDMTYSKLNKKYLCHDMSMPAVIGEKVSVICSIDTSGSVSEAELNSYVSEMIGIAKSFSQVDFIILTHDVDVHDCLKIHNGDINKIKNIAIHGGGGTAHEPLYNYIKEKRLFRETKLLISFTDGYSSFPEKKPQVETVFVLAGHHVAPDQMPKWATTLVLNS